MASPTHVVVVGAGIIGCAVAYELARRGASVQIVDDRRPGMGATQASAGVLAPYIEARHGGTLLDLTTRSLDLFDGFAADVAASSHAPVSYHRTGTLDVALLPDSMRLFSETAAMLGRRGQAAHVLDAAAVRAAEPTLSSSVVGGLLIPLHGYVAAGELTRALAEGARRHGACFVDQGRVHRVSASTSGLEVHADRGLLQAHVVVLAAGSWTAQIAVDGTTDRVPVKPIRGQLLQLGWDAPSLQRVMWGERCYMVPWRDGTVLVGATVEDAGFDERTTTDGVRDLIDAASELVPELSRATFTAAKVGLRPATPDEVPIIGASTVVPNLIYATGHYRNGVLLSPLTARLVADAILDGVFDPVLEQTGPGRFGRL